MMYNAGMELVEQCKCGEWKELDWLDMEKRQISKLYTLEGYTCSKCGRWKPSFFSTRQLDEHLKRLSEMKPTHPSFWYYFVRTRNRAEEIQKRGRNL